MKPFLLACESKHAKLASIALVSFQKLLANDAVSEEGVPLIIAGLEQVQLSCLLFWLRFGRNTWKTHAMH